MTINQIAEILERFIEIHTMLIELAKEKTPVLVSNQIEGLNAILSKERKLVSELNALDAKRVQLTGDYLIARGYVPDPRVNISDLIRLTFKADEKLMLQALQERLLNSIAELRLANELNQQLIEQSLEFIDYSLDLLIEPPGEDMIYQNPNQPTGKSTTTLMFDSRA